MRSFLESLCRGKEAATPKRSLAYEKDVPTNGGKVMMADGTVKTMSAAD